MSAAWPSRWRRSCSSKSRRRASGRVPKSWFTCTRLLLTKSQAPSRAAGTPTSNSPSRSMARSSFTGVCRRK
ncbi:vacuolar protein sorting 36-like protein [Phyllostomus discolor]|uniref:Vacuolar protein sorting 36-like protein n=1 Tax=Phyllostomus discolor TaxID=89673 RepID=A0A833Z565_9CHIR|nr:vacuolar protein sorting 36-like protein [Phyllostomus discolor]